VLYSCTTFMNVLLPTSARNGAMPVVGSVRAAFTLGFQNTTTGWTSGTQENQVELELRGVGALHCRCGEGVSTQALTHKAELPHPIAVENNGRVPSEGFTELWRLVCESTASQPRMSTELVL
jgi:hypothetical protein